MFNVDFKDAIKIKIFINVLYALSVPFNERAENVGF